MNSVRMVASISKKPTGEVGPHSTSRVSQNPDEIDRVAAYLAGATTVVATTARAVDKIDPAKGNVVPIGIVTDGTFTWSPEMSYYLREYGILPPDEMLRHIESLHYEAPQVSDDIVETTRDYLNQLQH